MSIDLTYVLVGVALLFAAFVKGATGLGFPLIATPTVALLLDIRIAVTILILPNLLMDVTQVFRDGFPSAILRRFKSMIGLTMIGVFLGTMVLVMLPLWALNLCLGIMVIVFVISNLLKFDFTISPAAEKILSPIVGLLSGFLNGMTNAAGPVLAMARSADGDALPVDVELLLPGFVSVVAVVTVAVFGMAVPVRTAGVTLTVSVKTPDASGARDAIEHETVPPAPTAGVVHAHPPGDARETNVVPAGSVSDSATVTAVDGPAFATVSV